MRLGAVRAGGAEVPRAVLETEGAAAVLRVAGSGVPDCLVNA